MPHREKINVPYLYVLAKSIWENDGDIIECCSPFVLSCLDEEENIKVTALHEIIIENFNLNIPHNALLSILNFLRAKKFVIRSNHNTNSPKLSYKLSKAGIAEISKYHQKDTVNDKLDNLYNDIERYFIENKLIISKKEIEESLYQFARGNIDSMLCVFFSQCNFTAESFTKLPSTNDLNKNDILLIRYIEYASNEKPVNYNTLKDMVLGILLTIVGCIDKDIKDKSQFSGLKVYLDSNFIFSLLNLRETSFVRPAKELYDLLTKYDFDLYVFDFTLDEIVKVLSRYAKDRHRYFQGIRVNSIIGSLKNQGFSQQDVLELITQLEIKLAKFNIQIENTKIDLENYSPKNINLSEKIVEYKGEQDDVSRNHDIAAIEHIQKFRKSKPRNLSQAQAIFLTSDGKLCNFNYLEMGHKHFGTICDVILDRMLTTILWLLEPNFNISLESLIAVCARDLFIKKKVWEKFYQVVEEIYDNKEFTPREISTLFFHNQIENELINIKDDDVDIIDKEYIEEQIIKSKKTLETYGEDEARRRTCEIADCLDNREKDLEKHQEKIDNLKKTNTVNQEKIENLEKAKVESIEKIESLEKANIETNHIISNMIDSIINHTLTISKRRAFYLSLSLVIVLLIAIFNLYFIYKSESNLLSMFVALVFSSGLLGFYKHTYIFFTVSIFNSIAKNEKIKIISEYTYIEEKIDIKIKECISLFKQKS